MINILLSLAIAAATFFGPLVFDETGRIGEKPGSFVAGGYFAERPVSCILDQNFSVTGDCAPRGQLLGKAVTATVAAAAVSAALSVIGLLPVVGRLTSLITIVAGAIAVITFGILAVRVYGLDGGSISQFRWGAFGMGGFGLLAVFAGLAGIRGHRD